MTSLKSNKEIVDRLILRLGTERAWAAIEAAYSLIIVLEGYDNLTKETLQIFKEQYLDQKKYFEENYSEKERSGETIH